MRPDAVSRAALHRAVALSAEVGFQLRELRGTSPLLAILNKAQSAAASAIVHLADADAENPQEIRTLQNEVRCFDKIIEWLKEIVADGFDAGDLLDMSNREDLAGALGISEDDASDVLENGLPPTAEE